MANNPIDRYYRFSHLQSKFTVQGAGALVKRVLEDALLVDIEVTIPPGHNGLTGIRVLQSGAQILPWRNSPYLIGDSYTRVFPINTEIGANSIATQAFNNDFVGHSFYITFHIQDLPRATPGLVTQPVLTVADGILNGQFDNLPLLSG